MPVQFSRLQNPDCATMNIRYAVLLPESGLFLFSHGPPCHPHSLEPRLQFSPHPGLAAGNQLRVGIPGRDEPRALQPVSPDIEWLLAA